MRFWRTLPEAGSRPLRVELPDPQVDPDEARRIVDEVLSRPEYADVDPGLFEQVMLWITDGLDRLIGVLAGTGTGTLLAWLIVVLVLGVIAFLLVRFFRRMQRSPELPQAFSGEVGRQSRDWAAEASSHEAAGRLREAIRCHYRALIAELAATGELEEVPGRTAREYLIIARRAPRPWLEPLERATGIFEPAWYSEQPVEPSDLEVIKQARDDVEGVRQRGQREPAP